MYLKSLMGPLSSRYILFGEAAALVSKYLSVMLLTFDYQGNTCYSLKQVNEILIISIRSRVWELFFFIDFIGSPHLTLPLQHCHQPLFISCPHSKHTTLSHSA